MRYWKLTAATLALLISGAAYSATVELEGTTATAVNNLEVNGVLYNVIFDGGVWPEVLEQGDIVFDTVTVFDAAAALNEALNDTVAISTGEPGGAGIGLYSIPVAELGGNVLWLGGAYLDGVIVDGELQSLWTSDIFNNPFAGSADPEFPLSWAKFTVVPVPAAAWLFGSALGLLGWVRRRAS